MKSRILVHFRSCLLILAISTLHITSLIAQDCNKNWVLTRTYDENGNEVDATTAFFDNNGKEIQLQTRNESTRQILVSQILQDFYGRSVGHTLKAPISGQLFKFSDNFLRSAGGAKYTFLNFDGDATNLNNPYTKLNNPEPAANNEVGTLGWYYSNNNTLEPLVATTGFPYSRLDYFHDGTGAVKRVSGIGEQLKMGTGKEVTNNSFPVQHELDDYLAIRNKFFPTSVVGAGPVTLAGQALQTVARDQNGTTVLAITDLSGKMNLISGRADANGYLTLKNVVNLTNQKPLYSFVATNPGFTISSLTVYSTNVVTVTSLNDNTDPACGCVSPDYTGVGNNYTYNGQDHNSYKVTSEYPFTVTEKLLEIPLRDPIVTQYDQAEGQLVEPAGSSMHYFQLNNPTTVTISGTGYSLYDMIKETDITSGFTNGSVLPAGFYKVVANAGQISGANPTGLNNVTVTYTNKYSDLTFNYYNQLGQLVASIAPNGVQSLLQNGYASLTSANQLPFITQYQYDLQGRRTSVSTPDNGTTQIIYRQDGKIRFTQNAFQKNAANAGSGKVERFSYLNYDGSGRTIESGEYAVSSATFSTLAANNAVLEATGTAASLSGATKVAQVNIFYDLPASNLSLSGYVQDAGFLKGSVSYMTNANGTTWYNYDDHGRVTWLVKQLTGLPGYKTVNYTYNDIGKVSVVDYQRNTPAERFLHYYTYDADGKFINVQTSTDGSTMTQQAHYYYYAHGPLKRIELGDQLQGLDYTYTLQGWLKAINSPAGDPTKDPMQDGVANSFAKDAFGMQLEYFNGDYARTGSNVKSVPTGSTPYFNGNITGMGWQSNKPSSVLTGDPSIQGPTMYSFSYDPMYQYTQALWGSPNYTNGSFSPQTKYAEKNISYDQNGNLQSLQRTDVNSALKHDFSKYTYAGNTNKLTSVGTASAPTSYANYTYDEIGRMKSEQQNQGSALKFFLQYDVTDRVVGVYSDAAMTAVIATYAYDELGHRVKMVNSNGTTFYVYDSSGSVIAIYTATTAAPTPVLAEQPVYGMERLGNYFKQAANYVYEMRDNVGSVRLVINRNKLNGQADVVQYTDYYPYGFPARKGGVGYRYEYQGTSSEIDPATGFNNFNIRLYDSAIGRWLTTDPANQDASPYEGMGNNPVSAVDPTGGAHRDKATGQVVADPSDADTYGVGGITVVDGKEYSYLNGKWEARYSVSNAELESMYYTEKDAGRDPFAGNYGVDIQKWAYSWAGFQSGYQRNAKALNFAKQTALMTAYATSGGLSALEAPLGGGAAKLLSLDKWWLKGSTSIINQGLMGGFRNIDWSDVAFDTFTSTGLNAVGDAAIDFQPFNDIKSPKLGIVGYNKNIVLSATQASEYYLGGLGNEYKLLDNAEYVTRNIGLRVVNLVVEDKVIHDSENK